jgi:hypothetical protein
MIAEEVMQLEEAIKHIKSCSDQMNARYGKIVFDEWAVVSLVNGKAGLVHYTGPRLAGFQTNFAADAAGLRESFLTQKYAVGDFEFTRHGVGTSFESFMVLGEGLYLICNNTKLTMDMIAKEPTWLEAQKPFVELSEAFCASPLEV